MRLRAPHPVFVEKRTATRRDVCHLGISAKPFYRDGDRLKPCVTRPGQFLTKAIVPQIGVNVDGSVHRCFLL
jgi:hypothetical protein